MTVRLALAAALLAVLVIDGATLLTRATDGATAHYTVNLDSGVDADLIARQHAESHGFIVEKVFDNDGSAGYVAYIPEGRADQIRDDARVAYTTVDTELKVNKSWWDSMLETVRQYV